MTEVPPQRGDETFSEGLLEAPRFEDGKAMLLAGLRGNYTIATMGEIPELWERFVPYINKVPGKKGHVAYGVCFPLQDGFDYMAAVEVQSSEGVPPELDVVTMPSQRYAVFEHRGHVTKIQETCRAIERDWLPKSRYSLGLGPAGFFERYGEGFDPKIGEGDIEVWVPIR